MSSDSKTRGGVSFLGALFLLFLGLKLGGAIAWSWWLVFAPLWAPVAIVVAIYSSICFLAFAGYGVYLLIEAAGKRRKARR